MNWKRVAMLSGFGAVMSVATVFVVPPSVEPVCWLVIFVVCAALIARARVPLPFVHGLMVGVFNSFWMIAGHELFFDAYLAGHPQEAATPTFGIARRVFMVIFGLLIGVVSGLVLGLFSWIASKLVKRVTAAS